MPLHSQSCSSCSSLSPSICFTLLRAFTLNFGVLLRPFICFPLHYVWRSRQSELQKSMVAFCSAAFIESVKKHHCKNKYKYICAIPIYYYCHTNDNYHFTAKFLLILLSLFDLLHSTLKQQTADLKVFVDCRLIASALKLINPIAKCRGRPSFVTLYSLWVPN